MADRVFHIRNDEVTTMPLRPMRAGIQGRNLEDALQTILEKHPEVLPGAEITADPSNPLQFALLRREMPVSSTWSLDHLYVDQTGVLTLVETKLFQNPESRREVVGQIVEYAANAVTTWNSASLREEARAYWANRDEEREFEAILDEVLSLDGNIDEFWNRVDENIKAQKLRLLIAADELRPEVKKMIEFLNAEFRNVQIFGLELRCYASDDNSVVLVPRLIGQSQMVAERKRTPNKETNWTIARLRSTYSEFEDRTLADRLQRLLDWAIEAEVVMTGYAVHPTFGVRGLAGERLFSVYSDGAVFCSFEPHRFLSPNEERLRLASELTSTGLLPEVERVEDFKSGRFLKHGIAVMDDATFEAFHEVLRRWSRQTSTSKGT